MAPTLDPATTGICDAVLAALPATVLDGTRRPTTGGPATTAWGDPAITLRCGVDVPAGLGPASECLEVNGVGWYEERQPGGSLFTTIGRPAYVELAVPSHYAPEAGALVDVAHAISDHDPVQTPCVG